MITATKKVMTKKLITVPMGTTLFEANQLMLEKRLRHLPILDESDEVVGVLSQRDLQYVPNSKKISVEMMMNTPVQFVTEETPLRKAIFQMLQSKISCLLVADASANAIGIVTTDDLLGYLSHLLLGETEEDMSLIKFKVKQTIGEIARGLSQMGI